MIGSLRLKLTKVNGRLSPKTNNIAFLKHFCLGLQGLRGAKIMRPFSYILKFKGSLISIKGSSLLAKRKSPKWYHNPPTSVYNIITVQWYLQMTLSL